DTAARREAPAVRGTAPAPVPTTIRSPAVARRLSAAYPAAWAAVTATPRPRRSGGPATATVTVRTAASATVTRTAAWTSSASPTCAGAPWTVTDARSTPG